MAVPPPYPAPPYPGSYPPPYYPPPGWAPPPPRPPEATFANLFTGTFTAFFKDLGVFVLVYAVLTAVIGGMSYGLAVLFLGPGTFQGSTGAFFGIPDVPFMFTGLPSTAFLLAFLTYGIVVVILTAIVASVVIGAVTHFAVQRIRGTPVTVRESFVKALERFPSILGAQLLLSVLIVGLVLAPIIGLAAGAFARNFAVLGISVLALIVLIPVVIFLEVALSLNAPAIMIEGRDAVGGLRRSWELTRGRRLSIFAASLIIGLIVYVVSVIGSTVTAAYPYVAVLLAVNVFVQGIVGSWSVILAAVAYDLILKERERWASLPPYPWPYYPPYAPSAVPPAAPPSAPPPST